MGPIPFFSDMWQQWLEYMYRWICGMPKTKAGTPCTFRTLRQGQASKNWLSAECLAELPTTKPYKVILWNHPNLIIPGSPHDHRNNIFLEHIKKLFSNIIITQWIFKAQIKIISLQVVKGIVSFGSWNLYIIFLGENWF